MKAYLVGYSHDEGGREALRLGTILARSAGGRLIVAVIVPKTWDHPSPARVDAEYANFLVHHADTTLASARREMPDDIPAEFLQYGADSAGAGLSVLADETQAGAIVLGSSRKAPTRRFQEGTVATELLYSARVPVVLAPCRYMAPYDRISRITCAIASTESSFELVRRAGMIAQDFGVPLRIATFVVRDKQMYPSIAGYDVENLVMNEFRRQAQVVHDRIREEWTGPDAPQSVYGDGQTWEEAVGKLDWKEDELLVVGSSRLGALMRVFLGSNSSKILHYAPVPRMIIPRLGE